MHAFTTGDEAELLVAERSSLPVDGEALPFITVQVWARPHGARASNLLR